VTIQMTK